MKRFFLILAIVSMAVAAQAQLLWKVSGNGLGRPSYIFGTHHMAPSSMIDQIDGIAQAITDCDVVVGEVDKEMLMKPEVQLEMAQAMMAPTDSTLDKLYTPEDYAVIEQVFDKYFSTMGVKLSQMNTLKPMAISIQLQAMQAIKYFPNYDGKDIIDMAVQQRANDEGRPSVGLETVQEQLDMLYNGSIAEQALGLLVACQNDGYFQEQSVKLAEAYLQQDLDKMLEVTVDPAMGGDNEEVFDMLIFSRNRNWAQKLRMMMPERACLVCIGALHLPGDKGLLQLLRNYGYTVEPVK